MMSFGLRRKRAGDADALALTAGELVRIALGVVGVEADLSQQFLDPAALVGRGRPRAAAARH